MNRFISIATLSVIFTGILALIFSSCENSRIPVEIENSNTEINFNKVPMKENKAEYIGYFHNRALEIFYSNGLDQDLKNVKNKLRSNEVNSTITDNFDNYISILEKLSNYFMEKYGDEFSSENLNATTNFLKSNKDQIVLLGKENPNLNTMEILTLFSYNSGFITENEHSYYMNIIQEDAQNIESLRSCSNTCLSESVNTIFQYSKHYWENEHGNILRVKKETVGGFVYDTVGTLIGGAISGGVGGFILGALMSGAYSEYGGGLF